MRLRLLVCDFVAKNDKLHDRRQKARCMRKQPRKYAGFLLSDNAQKNIKKMTINA